MKKTGHGILALFGRRIYCGNIGCRLGSNSWGGEQKGGEAAVIVPDIVNLIIWVIAGGTGGSVAGDLLKGDYDLGPGNMIAGAIGGVFGAFILQTLIPALSGIGVGPIIGQLIVAAVSGAVLTVATGAVQTWRGRQ